METKTQEALIRQYENVKEPIITSDLVDQIEKLNYTLISANNNLYYNFIEKKFLGLHTASSKDERIANIHIKINTLLYTLYNEDCRPIESGTIGEFISDVTEVHSSVYFSPKKQETTTSIDELDFTLESGKERLTLDTSVVPETVTEEQRIFLEVFIPTSELVEHSRILYTLMAKDELYSKDLQNIIDNFKLNIYNYTLQKSKELTTFNKIN